MARTCNASFYRGIISTYITVMLLVCMGQLSDRGCVGEFGPHTPTPSPPPPPSDNCWIPAIVNIVLLVIPK